MQKLENLDIFEILITQKLLKCPKDPFVRSTLVYMCVYVYSNGTKCAGFASKINLSLWVASVHSKEVVLLLFVL